MTDILTLTMNPSLDISTSIDKVVNTHKLRCGPEMLQPGGGGINVARVVREMGGDCRAIFTCGGYSGQRLKQLLELEKVEMETINVAVETRQCFSVHETSSDLDYRFLLPGKPLAEHEVHACLNHFDHLELAPRYLVASGSLPPGVPEDFYARLASLAHAKGSLFVLDASGPPLAQALKAGGLFLIKPSLQELEEFTGHALPTEQARLDAANSLITSGSTKYVVLSLGEEGALLVSKDLSLRAPAIPVKPLSTVGAGDSFVGGMIWALNRGLSVEDAFRYGLSCATGTLLNIHSQMCEAGEVARLYKLARISRI